MSLADKLSLKKLRTRPLRYKNEINKKTTGLSNRQELKKHVSWPTEGEVTSIIETTRWIPTPTPEEIRQRAIDRKAARVQMRLESSTKEETPDESHWDNQGPTAHPGIRQVPAVHQPTEVSKTKNVPKQHEPNNQTVDEKRHESLYPTVIVEEKMPTIERSSETMFKFMHTWIKNDNPYKPESKVGEQFDVTMPKTSTEPGQSTALGRTNPSRWIPHLAGPSYKLPFKKLYDTILSASNPAIHLRDT